MNAIDLVLVNTQSSPHSSPEFHHGWARLQRAVGPQALWMQVPSTNVEALRSVLARELSPGHLSTNARVLVLAHAHVLLTQGVLARLVLALDTHLQVASVCAFDSHQPPAVQPDYCTLRGLERFINGLQQEGSRPKLVDRPGTPLVTLTTLGAIYDARGNDTRAKWVEGAYVHDFSDYHQGRRDEVIPLLPVGTQRLLDVGGGEGGFLEAAKASLGCETHLAEASASACASARTRVDKVWEGDFLTQDFAAGPVTSEGMFDCITFLDVLEHTSDPGLWLEKAAALLRPGGSVVASIPNVGHWGVVADLLEGRWDYCPVGIHCVTHLRFFTEHSVRALFTDKGFELEQLMPVKVPCPAQWSEHWAKTPELKIQPAAWDDYAFLVRARPATTERCR